MKRHWTETHINLSKEHESLGKAFYVDLKNEPPARMLKEKNKAVSQGFWMSLKAIIKSVVMRLSIKAG